MKNDSADARVALVVVVLNMTCMNNLNCYQIFRLINKLHGSVSIVDVRGFTERVVLPLCIPTVRNIIKMDTDIENENQRDLPLSFTTIKPKPQMAST